MGEGCDYGISKVKRELTGAVCRWSIPDAVLKAFAPKTTHIRFAEFQVFHLKFLLKQAEQSIA